jgi:hypothetical protein
MAEAKKKGINLKLARIEARMAQLQAMKALVRELPKFTTQKKCSNNVEEIVDATTKFQWETIKTLATKEQEVEGKAKGKTQEVEDTDKGKVNVIEVEDDDWGDDELLANFSNNSYLRNELQQNCIWVCTGATATRVMPNLLARLIVQSRQDAWRDSCSSRATTHPDIVLPLVKHRTRVAPCVLARQCTESRQGAWRDT